MEDHICIHEVCSSYNQPVPATPMTRGRRNTPRSRGHRLGKFKDCVQEEFDVNNRGHIQSNGDLTVTPAQTLWFKV